MKKSGKKNGARRRKPSPGIQLAAAFFAVMNVILTIALHIIRREEIIHAVADEEKVRLLLLEKNETTAEKSEKEA